MSTVDAILRCPECAGPVAASGSELCCAACQRAWPLERGVACFGHSPNYPVGLPGEQLAEALSIAEASGWQAALHDYLRPLDPHLYRRAVDEYRAQWRCLVPRHSSARLLDLRCGWGPVSVGLAPDYGLVVAAETSYELARFTALRAEAAGLPNLVPICLDPARRLPFADGFFDVVVLQEVVEWSPASALLREMSRIMAPGGWLFLSAGNRLDLSQLLHGAQPRLASRDAAHLLPQRARPRTLPGYGQVLRAAGFAVKSAFGLLPSATEPFFIVPLGSRGGIRYFLDSLFQNPGLRRGLVQRNLLAVYRAAQAGWRLARFLPVEDVVRQLLPAYGLLATKRA